MVTGGACLSFVCEGTEVHLEQESGGDILRFRSLSKRQYALTYADVTAEMDPMLTLASDF